MRTSHPTPAPWLVLTALLTVQVLFGVNYAISKVIVDTFPPLVWGSLRLVVAGIVMLAIAYFSHRAIPQPRLKFFLGLIPWALLGIIINQSSFLIGLHYTTPSNSAILNTLTPIFTLLIVIFRGQENATLKRVIGFLSAFIGVLVLRRVEDFSLSNQTLKGDLLTLLNCLSFSFFLSFGKEFIEKHDQVWTTAWLFAYGSLGMGLFAFPDWLTFTWPVMSSTLWFCLVFAIFGGTLLTYFLNTWSLKHCNSSNVAIFIYIQPSIAIGFSWLWLGQPVTLRTIISCALIFVGVLLATFEKTKK